MSGIDTNNLAGLADSLTQLIELASNHRFKAVEAGFSDEHAQRMAVDLHYGLVRSIFKLDPET